MVDGVASPDLLPSMTWSVVRMLGALGLLGLGAWALLRWQRRGANPREAVRVVARAVLTRGASLALVSVGGKRLLLGISGDGVRLITDLEPGVACDLPNDFDAVLAEAKRDDKDKE